MRKFTSLLFCLFCLVSLSNAQIVVTSFTPPDNAQPELVICGAPAIFTLEIVGNEAENVVLDLDMTFNGMTGIEYIPGSFMPQINEDASNLQQPSIGLGDIDGTQTFTFEAVVDCDMIGYLEGGGLAIFDFDFAYQDTAGVNLTYNFQNSSANGSQEFNNSVRIPNVAIIGGTNTAFVADDLGEMYTREIRIEQSGLVSSLEELVIEISYGSGVSVTDQQINGIPVSPADFVLIPSGPGATVYQLTLNTTDFATYNIGDGDNLFESPTVNPADNEFFIWSEKVTIEDCEARGTLFEASWGCNGEDCNSSDTQFDAALSTNPPNIVVTRQTRTYPACFDGATLHTYTIENRGTGFATNLLFRIRTENQNYSGLDASTITYQIGTGAVQNFDVNGLSNEINLPASNCYAGMPNFYDRVDTEIVGSLAPGEVLTLTFETYQCCIESCGSTKQYFGSSVEARYNLLCGSATVIRTSSFNTVDVNSLGAATIPAAMNLGDTESFIFNLMTFDGDMTQLNGQGEYCMTIDIPANLSYDPANTLEWVASDGSMTLTPSSLSPSGVVSGPATIEACFSNGFGASTSLFRNSNVVIDLTYDNCVCGVNVNTSMDLFFRYGPACSDACELRLFCENGSTFLAPGGCCSGTGCDGLVTTDYQIERTCFGLPDNDQDGCPDATGTLDFTNIRMDRAMKGDEMRFTSTGEIRLNSGTLDSLENIYFESSFTSGSMRLINPIGNNSLTITDVSTGLTYTCTDIASINDANTITYDISVQEIRGCNDVPVDFVFEDGDIVMLSGDVVNTENIGCNIDNVEYINCFYGSLTPAPVTAGNRLKCNPPRLGGFTAVGYSIRERNGTRRFTGCGYENEYWSEFCIGGAAEGTDPFPYEYRQWSYVTESKIAMPSGYLFNRSTYRSRATRFTQSIIDQTVTNASLVQLVNDTFVNDFASIYQTCGSNPFLQFSDDGNDIRSEFIFDVPCTAELNVDKEAYHEITRVVEFCSPFIQSETHTNGSTHTFTPTGPELRLQAGNSFSEPDGTSASWELFLDNFGNGANNAFLVILDAPNITVDGLSFSGGGAVPETNGIYQLGDLALGGTIPFLFDFTYASCELDSIQVVAGFDCLGYPADRLEILSGGWPCDLDTLTLYTRPLSGKVKQDLIQSPSLVQPCDELTYELQVTNIDRAILYDTEVSVFLPYSSGMEFIPNTEEACYPCNASAPVYNFPIFTPTEIVVTTLGIEYIWDIESLIAQIDNNGFSGLEDPDIMERVLRIQFDVKTNCDFTVGDFPRFRSSGRTACGAVTNSIIQSGEVVAIEGTGSAYRSLIDLNVLDPDGPINACGGMATLETSVQFTNTTDGLDSIMIVLPPGVTYDPGSVFFSNALFVYSTTPTINMVNGIQEVKFGVRPNIPAFTPIDFVLDVNTNPDLITCRFLEQPILARTYIPNAVSCDGVSCDLSVLTGSTEEPVAFAKYEYDIIDYDLSAACGGSELMLSLTIQNNGIYPIIEPTNIDIFFDADNSGTNSAGDLMIGTLNTTSIIPVGGSIILSETLTIDPTQGCPLIASFNGCTCVEEIPLDNLSRNNAGRDTIICNNGSVELGCGENEAGFSYFWSGLNGAPITALSDRMLPNPQFMYNNTNTSSDTLHYALVTTVGECMSTDTIQIIVLPTITTVAANSAICPGSPVVLNGPLGFTNYQWTPVVDLSDDTIPRPTINSLTTPSTTYTLSYINAEGCLEQYEETVDFGFNCTDVELDKTVDLTTANVGDLLTYTLVLVNQGPLPASGVQVTDQLPSSLQYVSHSPAVELYDPSTGIWDIGVVLVGDTFTLDIMANVLEVGLINNVAEVSAMDNTDSDSSPNNGNPNEDDYGETCTTVPTIIACDFEVPILTAPNADSYQWYIDGVAIPNATASTFQPDAFMEDAYFGTHTYSLYPDESCGYELQIDRCTADLSLTKTATPTTALLGDIISYTIVLQNDGPADATNIQVAEIIPQGLSYTSHTATNSFYNSLSGNWEIPALPIGGIETLTIEMELVEGGRFIDNTTEIIAADQPDIDSTPDNDDGDQSEDDEDKATIFSAYVADIGNFVWNDINQNGIQDIGEAAMPSVSVSLFDANTNTLIATQLTDTNGEYYFRDIPLGDYFLIFDIANTAAYTDFVATLQDNFSDGKDSDISVIGRTDNFSFDPFLGDDFTIDAGFHLNCEPPAVQVFGN